MTATPRTGRPPLENPRRIRVKVHLTVAEDAALRINSARLGKSRAEAIRDAMRAYGLLPPARGGRTPTGS